VPTGTVVALVGGNGAGKSTVVAALAGTVPLTGGRVLLDGREVTRLWPHQRAAAGLRVVPDVGNVFPGLTVAQNLAQFARGGDVAAALAVFPELGRHLEQAAGTLSGGERQMLALARLLVRPGRCLVLDEPVRALSPGAIARAYAALRSQATPDRAVLIVDAPRPELLALAGIVYVLRRGVVGWAGEPVELTPAQRQAVLAERPAHAR
jgi:branched-chain amino acid transport system ATP-binding protein